MSPVKTSPTSPDLPGTVGDQVQYAFGEAGLLEYLGHDHTAGHRGGLGGLQHRGVAVSDGKNHGPQGQQQSRVPGGDAADHAPRADATSCSWNRAVPPEISCPPRRRPGPRPHAGIPGCAWTGTWRRAWPRRFPGPRILAISSVRLSRTSAALKNSFRFSTGE